MSAGFLITKVLAYWRKTEPHRTAGREAGSNDPQPEAQIPLSISPVLWTCPSFQDIMKSVVSACLLLPTQPPKLRFINASQKVYNCIVQIRCQTPLLWLNFQMASGVFIFTKKKFSAKNHLSGDIFMCDFLLLYYSFFKSPTVAFSNVYPEYPHGVNVYLSKSSQYLHYSVTANNCF